MFQPLPGLNGGRPEQGWPAGWQERPIQARPTAGEQETLGSYLVGMPALVLSRQGGFVSASQRFSDKSRQSHQRKRGMYFYLRNGQSSMAAFCSPYGRKGELPPLPRGRLQISQLCNDSHSS